MSATIRLLELWKNAQRITSDNAAAIELGIGRAAISRWRGDDTNAEPALIARMAKEVNEDPVAWILAVEAEKQKPESRKVLMDLAKRLGYAAMLAVTLALPYSLQENDGVSFGRIDVQKAPFRCILCQIKIAGSQNAQAPTRGDLQRI